MAATRIDECETSKEAKKKGTNSKEEPNQQNDGEERNLITLTKWQWNLEIRDAETKKKKKRSKERGSPQ